MSSKPFLHRLAVAAAAPGFAAAIVLMAPAAYADEPSADEVAIVSDGGPRVDAEGNLVENTDPPVEMPGTPPADAETHPVVPLGAGVLVAGAAGAATVAVRRRSS